jgi:hypothetical protein
VLALGGSVINGGWELQCGVAQQTSGAGAGTSVSKSFRVR